MVVLLVLWFCDCVDVHFCLCSMICFWPLPTNGVFLFMFVVVCFTSCTVFSSLWFVCPGWMKCLDCDTR